MALTPDEARELAQLEAAEQDHQDRTTGTKAVDTVDRGRLKVAAPEARPFTFYRATVGGLRDAAQGLMDFTDTLADPIQKRLPLPGVVFGADAQNGIVGLASAS